MSVAKSPTTESPAVLVLAAVERELAPLRRLLRTTRLDEGVNLELTGAGKSQAAVLTDRAIARWTPTWVVEIGCAGGFPDVGIEVGDVAIATDEIFADDGVETPGGFLTMTQLDLPLAKRGAESLFERVPTSAPSSDELDVIRDLAGEAWKVLTGPLVTVSCASGTNARAELLARRWSPIAESLEGAAVAATAWTRRVRFSEIRGISNLVGDRERDGWEIDRACENAANTLLAWLQAGRPTSEEGASLD